MQHIIFVVVRGHGQHNTMVTQLIDNLLLCSGHTKFHNSKQSGAGFHFIIIEKKKTVLLASVTANIEKETFMYNLSTPNRSDDSPCLSLAINNN